MKQASAAQRSAVSYCSRILIASAGLFVYAAGIWMTLQADIGLSPWDALTMGLAGRFHVSFGVISILTSFVVLTADLLLHESIGLGTVLDAFLIGIFIDLFHLSGLSLPPCGFLPRVLFLTAGLFVMCFGEYLYMRPGLGCGPRDALVVGLGRRLPRVPIGAVNAAVLLCVLLLAWIAGGSIGIGTLISAAGTGVTAQIVFFAVRFEPRSILHEDLLQSLRFLFGKNT